MTAEHRPAASAARNRSGRSWTVRATGLAGLAGLGWGVALLWALPARAADLQLMPDGFAEAWAEHGIAAILPHHIPQFWGLVLFFAVLTVLLNRFAISPLLEVLEERERRIHGAKERAAEIAEQATQLLDRHGAALREVRDRAQSERQQVLEHARSSAQERLDGARREAEQSTQSARRDVESALREARGAIRNEADGVAEAIADRLLGAGV